MTQDSDHPMSDAAHMFESQRAELSLLRRAIERLTDERSEQPDYGPSFEALDRRLARLEHWAKDMAQRPGLTLTPEGIATGITKAAATTREQDRQMLQEATSGMIRQAQAIGTVIGTARTKDHQAGAILLSGIGSAILGMLLWAALPGMVARALPTGWAIPERLAARTLRTDMWEGGQRMMTAANPQRWKQITDLVRQDAERAAAQKQTAKAKAKAQTKPRVRRRKTP